MGFHIKENIFIGPEEELEFEATCTAAYGRTSVDVTVEELGFH